jgi:hypothetical protein
MIPKIIMHRLMFVIIIEYLEGKNSTATNTRTAKPINNPDPTFQQFWAAQVFRRYICDCSTILIFYNYHLFRLLYVGQGAIFTEGNASQKRRFVGVWLISFFPGDQYEDRVRKDYPRRPTGVGLGRVVLVLQGGGTAIMMGG